MLREGLKNDTLATLLFPRDPVGNAPGLIRALATAFPARRGSYLLGLLAKIGWFTPTLVLLDLALISGVRRRAAPAAARAHQLRCCPRPTTIWCGSTWRRWASSTSMPAPPRSTRVLVDSRLAHKFALTGAMACARAGLRARPELRAGGRRLQPALRAAGGRARARARRHRAELGRQPAAASARRTSRSPPTPCSSARARLCTRPPMASAWKAMSASTCWCRSPRCTSSPTSTRSVQLKRGSNNLFMVVARRRARRPAAAARERQGDVRDLLVRLLGALRHDAGRRRAAAAAAGRRRAGAQLTQALVAPRRAGAPSCRPSARTGCAAQTLAPGCDAGARSARAAGGQAAGRAAQHRARHRHLRRGAGGRGPALCAAPPLERPRRCRARRRCAMRSRRRSSSR